MGRRSSSGRSWGLVRGDKGFYLSSSSFFIIAIVVIFYILYYLFIYVRRRRRRRRRSAQGRDGLGGGGKKGSKGWGRGNENMQEMDGEGRRDEEGGGS